MNIRLIQIVIPALAIAAGIAIGMSMSPGKDVTTSTTTNEAAPQSRGKPLYYRNPMNPAITSKVPARDEMGMDYIPVYADSATHPVAGTVAIDPVTIQSIGVRTAEVTRRTLAHMVHAPARIDYDEQAEARLHPRVDGWVEALSANETGRQVRKGDVLLSIYSPNLVTTEEEYLLTLEQLDNARKTGIEDAIRQARQIADASRERLVLLNVPRQTIEALETGRKVRRTLDVVSPYDGIITRIGVREGQYVTPATELFGIAGLSRVRVTVDVYEQDLPWVKQGDIADMQVVAAPGRIWTGRIDYIYPYMEAKSRAARVRLEFANEDGTLKPEMFATVNIHTSARHDAIVVPSEAIVRSGLHTQVFIARPGGKFEPRKVTTGIAAGGLTQILDGVSPGEEVVTSAQFLIDSESKLNEATAKMRDAGNSDHGAMQMDSGSRGPTQ